MVTTAAKAVLLLTFALTNDAPVTRGAVFAIVFLGLAAYIAWIRPYRVKLLNYVAGVVFLYVCDTTLGCCWA